MNKKYETLIKDVPNFPKEGIIFKDITPVLEDPVAFKEVIDEMSEIIKEVKPDIIVGVESRGFLFGAPLAINNNLPFILARKPNKLPRESISVSYDLEYGSSTIEIHKDAIKPNQKVLIIDDLLATGGTVGAVQKIVKQANATVVANMFLIELEFLNGKDSLEGKTYSLLKF